MAGSIPHSPIAVPQEGLPTRSVTQCYEEEDSNSGSGPGWIAPVSCLALVP